MRIHPCVPHNSNKSIVRDYSSAPDILRSLKREGAQTRARVSKLYTEPTCLSSGPQQRDGWLAVLWLDSCSGQQGTAGDPVNTGNVHRELALEPGLRIPSPGTSVPPSSSARWQEKEESWKDVTVSVPFFAAPPRVHRVRHLPYTHTESQQSLRRKRGGGRDLV